MVIDLGIVDNVGYVVENTDRRTKIKVQDFKHISEAEMLALIELGIREPMKGHIVTGLDADKMWGMEEEGEKPFFARDPVLSHLEYLRPHLHASKTEPISNNPTTATTNLSLAQLISESTKPEQLHKAVETALIKKLARSLMMQPNEISAGKAMSAYGTDSLVAVEMKNWVMREMGVGVSVFDILQSVNIGKLVGNIVDKLSEDKIE